MITILAPDDPGVHALARHIEARPAGTAEIVITPWNAYRAELDRALSEPATGIDVVAVPGHVWLAELVEDGSLAEMDVATGRERRDVVPGLSTDCRHGGRTYLLPLFSDGHIVLVRADLVTPSSAPLGPAELIRLARAGHHPPEVYGIALKASPAEIALDWLPHYRMAGGTITWQGTTPHLDSEAAATALERYLALARLAPPETSTFGNVEVAEAMTGGRVAVAVTWGGQAAPIFSKAPRGARLVAMTLRGSWNATWGLGIPARLGPTKRSAVEWALRELLTPELDLRVLQEAGSPVLRSTYRDAARYGNRYPWLEAQRTMLTRARPLPANARLGVLLATLTDALGAALQGEAVPEEAIRNTLQRITG